jgi:CheY-like chemotaxis protein
LQGQLTFEFAHKGARPGGTFPSQRNSTDAERDQQRALVLAVDDEPDALEYLRELIVGEGFDFVAAKSGLEALAICRERRPDVAIVDVMMPGMTGFELCDLLRSDIACRDLPIIVNSAYETKPYSNSGLYDVAFVKPAEPEDLIRAIRMLLPEDKLPG